MTRIKQKSDSRGSLKYIQLLINKNQSYINNLIKNNIDEMANEEIIWVSPLANDDYAEYRDDSFLEKVGLKPTEITLNNVWPKRGPQWDALAKTKNGTVILVEAKANVSEINSAATKAKEPSKCLIDKSLSEVKKFLLVENDIDWSGRYYQYTNRLFHLFHLREKCMKTVFLVNIYFVDDTTATPTSKQQFQKAIDQQKKHLGLNKHSLSNYVAEIFIDIKELKN